MRDKVSIAGEKDENRKEKEGVRWKQRIEEKGLPLPEHRNGQWRSGLN